MKILKHILAIALCVCAVQAASADGGSEKMLDDLAARIKAMGPYKVAFSMSAESSGVAGEYIVSGNKFYIKVPGIEVASDGVQRTEINHETKEIALDKPATASRNILSNPVGAFEFANDNFTSSYLGTETVNGKSCDMIKLVPKQKGSNILSLTLAVDKASGLPRSLSYSAEGIAGQVAVFVNSFTSYSGSGSVFTPDLSAYSDYETIDFR